MKRDIWGGHSMRARILLMVAVASLAGTALSACSNSASSNASASSPTSKVTTTTSGAPHYKGSLTLEPSSGAPGTVVKVVGKGLTANQTVQIAWQKASGSWQLTSSGQVLGASYSESYVPLASATTAPDGSLSASFTVPTGFGYSHEVQVNHAGQTLNEASFKVSLQASISPKSGPVGTPIHITLSGIGWTEYRQNWFLTYDQHLTGWLSAVTTEGTANITVPATGTPGLHELGLYEGADREPYLNTQQSPTKNPIIALGFTITPGPAVMPSSPQSQSSVSVEAATPTAVSNGPRIWLNDSSGPPGTVLDLKGSGFAKDQSVKLSWTTQTGNHLYGMGGASNSLANLTTDSNGDFETSFTAPSDLGESHKITATVGSTTASTSFTITPKDLGVSPSSGPVGTEITVHLEGTGVTWTSNIYGVTYDNSNIGYVCGVNSNGDITLKLRATGAPGLHYINLYPAIWKVTNLKFSTADYIQVPQLTYVADHPGGKVAAYEFAFDIT